MVTELKSVLLRILYFDVGSIGLLLNAMHASHFAVNVKLVTLYPLVVSVQTQPTTTTITTTMIRGKGL